MEKFNFWENFDYYYFKIEKYYYYWNWLFEILLLWWRQPLAPLPLGTATSMVPNELPLGHSFSLCTAYSYITHWHVVVFTLCPCTFYHISPGSHTRILVFKHYSFPSLSEVCILSVSLCVLGRVRLHAWVPTSQRESHSHCSSRRVGQGPRLTLFEIWIFKFH